MAGRTALRTATYKKVASNGRNLKGKLLAARLSPVRFKNGDCLAHDTLDGPHVLFPLNLVACLQFTRQRSGLGLVGREGFFGWSAVLDDNSQDEVEATVLMDGGTALAISVEDMRQACLSSATLWAWPRNWASGARA